MSKTRLSEPTNFVDNRYTVPDFASSRHDSGKAANLKATDFFIKQKQLYDNVLSQQMKQGHEMHDLESTFETLPELKMQYKDINEKMKRDFAMKNKIINNQSGSLANGFPVDSGRL